LVIRYAYLWKREDNAGRQEGSKDRPCVIVLAVIDDEGEQEVLVLPVTHASPDSVVTAIEIPPQTRQRLGLDSDRSWIVISESNEFVWPGPDIRSVPGGDESTIAYGSLPPRFFAYVRDQFLALDQRERAQRVRRTD
jgi:hypothetical protein